MTTTIKYGIILPDGTLARVEKYANDGDFCGDYTFRLTNNKSDPEWLVDDPADVAKTLFADIRWYNSDENRPCWGTFKQEQMQPAKITIQVEISPTDDVKIPININTLEVRSIPWAVAKTYAKMPELPKDKQYVFVLTAEIQDESVVGKIVAFDEMLTNMKKVIAVQLVSEDYDLEIKPQSFLICEEIDG